MTDIVLYALLSLLLVVGMALISYKVRSSRGALSARASDYERIETLMSPAERSLFGILNQIGGREFRVFAKVRMADVLTPAAGLDRSQRRAVLNRIMSKHFDFVICAPDDLRILCAVELDDRSHQRQDRRKRDAFVDSACAGSGLALLRIQAAAQYSPVAISEQLSAAISAGIKGAA